MAAEPENHVEIVKPQGVEALLTGKRHYYYAHII